MGGVWADGGHGREAQHRITRFAKLIHGLVECHIWLVAALYSWADLFRARGLVQFVIPWLTSLAEQ
jgi:hypothetical protein